MFSLNSCVRIKTIDELTTEKRRIEGRPAFLKWQNNLCEVKDTRTVQSRRQYKIVLLDAKDHSKETGMENILNYWWNEYELEEYEPGNIDKDAFSILITG